MPPHSQGVGKGLASLPWCSCDLLVMERQRKWGKPPQGCLAILKDHVTSMCTGKTLEWPSLGQTMEWLTPPLG